MSTARSSFNKVKLIRGGKDYFGLLMELINQATESIHVQAYIFDDDETGKFIADALKAASARKVSVHLLVDGYASQDLSEKFLAELNTAGVHFRFFEPFFKSKQFYFGRRMHHKIFVADGKYAITGGINISNRYNDMPGKPAWLDFALYVEGEVANDLCVLCWKTWNSFPEKMGLTPCEEMKLTFSYNEEERCKTAMKRNDWIRRKNEISETYVDMFTHAKSHINIMCSYFLPGKVIRRLLKNASKRGVKIRVITAGISDVKVAKYAERWMYDWLLRNKIELFEYEPTVLHAKVAICDSAWLTIGSYNINNLSAYASIELNVNVHNPGFALQADQVFDSIIKHDCVSITEEAHAHSKNIFKQFIRWCSYEMIRVIFYIVTYNFPRENKPVLLN
ncbi:MAG: phospholipase D-like domain-containing protein [Ferruginibacter sp.]